MVNLWIRRGQREVNVRLKRGQFVVDQRRQRMVNLCIKMGQRVVMKYLGEAHESLSQREVCWILALGSIQFC